MCALLCPINNNRNKKNSAPGYRLATENMSKASQQQALERETRSFYLPIDGVALPLAWRWCWAC